ncbi:hypothetical protein BsWGS_18677 [Bradybaena similaris]
MPECQYCILHYFASVLILFGILTTAWAVNWKADFNRHQKGLVKTCIGNKCVPHLDDPDIYNLISLGFYLSLLCDLLVTLHCLLKGSLPNAFAKILVEVVFWTSIIGAVVLIAGCGWFGFENFGNQLFPGYSFGLVFTGALILISAGTATSREQPPHA